MTDAADAALALAFAHGIPYAGLRDHRPDEAAAAAGIPAEAARAARVVVLSADEKRVRLAAAGPAPDLSALTDHLRGRRAEIAVAPADELEALLGPEPVAAQPEPVAAQPEPAPASHEPEPAADPRPSPAGTGPVPALRAALFVVLAFALIAGVAAVALWLAS